MAKDPTGEIGFFMAALIGALVSVTTNGITNMMNGRGFFVGWGKAALIGAFSGAASFGIGELGQLLEGVNKLTVGAMKTFLHAFSGGLASEFSGGDFATGFLSGAVGSLVGGAATKYLKKLKGFDKFIGVSLWGGVGGGISSVVAGGSFGDGFRNGAIAAGLNHSLHEATQEIQASIQRRKMIAQIAKILEGREGWAFDAAKDNFKIGTNKCNQFVYDVLKLAGASPGLPNGNRLGRWLRGEGGTSPPTAAQWADPNFEIPNWEVVSSPEFGDVAAYSYSGYSDATGHTAIMISPTQSIGANATIVRTTDFGYSPNHLPSGSKYVYRRYVGN